MRIASDPRVLLALTLVLIAGATLSPFRLVWPPDGVAIGRALQVGLGYTTTLDVLRNALLFMPFGWAAARVAAARRPASNPVLAVCGAAIVLAYFIEVAQGFMPSRFASVVDVAANAAGAGVGATASLLMAPRHTWLRVPAYVLAICAAAVPLNRATLLHNWAAYPLVVGNEASADRPWLGRVHEVCVSDRALDLQGIPADAPSDICSSIPPASVGGWYGGDGHTVLRDRTGRLPPLEWTGDQAGAPSPLLVEPPRLGGGWLFSAAAGEALSKRITRTGAFSVAVVFDPEVAVQQGPARIVSLSLDPDLRNFTLGHDQRDAIVRLRTPVTGENGTARTVRISGAFSTAGPHWAVFTYDGATQCLTVDRRTSCLSLTPGLAMAAALGRGLPFRGEPWAWDAVYYGAMFVPLGLLLGIGSPANRKGLWKGVAPFLIALGSAVILEWVSASVPVRAIRPEAIVQGTAWGCLGTLVYCCLWRPGMLLLPWTTPGTMSPVPDASGTRG